MKELLIATGNSDKVAEVRDILKVPIKIADIKIDEVQGMDLEYTAEKKAQAAFDQVGKPIIVDDVGLYIEALGGLPGPYAKDFLEALGRAELLELLKYKKNRNLVVKSAVGYHDGKRVHVFLGEVKGTLAYEERGTDGWGFDFIIIPEGQDKTYAEMGSSVKNTLSHRRRAFDKLREYLEEHN